MLTKTKEGRIFWTPVLFLWPSSTRLHLSAVNAWENDIRSTKKKYVPLVYYE